MINATNHLYLFQLFQHAEKDSKSRKLWFWLPCEQGRMFGGQLKLFRFMSIVMVQAKFKLNNAELFLKMLYIQSKEMGN